MNICLLCVVTAVYWHCLHSMWSRVYETVQRPSVHLCLSVPLFDCGMRRVCCWAPCRQEILINSSSAGITSGGSAARCSAANAGSVTFIADMGNWTWTCFLCSNVRICYITFEHFVSYWQLTHWTAWLSFCWNCVDYFLLSHYENFHKNIGFYGAFCIYFPHLCDFW